MSVEKFKKIYKKLLKKIEIYTSGPYYCPFFSSKFQETNLSSLFQKHYAVFTIAFAFFIEYMLGYDENEASAILRLDRREKEIHSRSTKSIETEPKPTQKN